LLDARDRVNSLPALKRYRLLEPIPVLVAIFVAIPFTPALLIPGIDTLAFFFRAIIVTGAFRGTFPDTTGRATVMAVELWLLEKVEVGL
jgi:hypothetical protein